MPIKDAYKHTLDGVSKLVSGSNWKADKFALHKAGVCAAFSRLVYCYVTKEERAAQNRFMAVPCIDYQDIVRQGLSVDLTEILRRGEFGENHFTVVTEAAVLLGVVSPEFIMIAIRGTQTFSDWGYNLNAVPHNTQTPDFMPITLHAGFHKATRDFIEPITKKLCELGNPPSQPIYVTGHSLGGAMAALFHMLWYLQDTARQFHCVTRSCYTFGMPRYGDQRAVDSDRSPFHIINPRDLVPRTPPKMGIYADPRFEFHVDGRPFKRSSDLGVVKKNPQLLADHSMQRYFELVRAACT